MASTEKNDDNEGKWCYSEGNQWIDFDKETSDQLEKKLKITIEKNTKKQRIAIQVKLDQGPIYGTDDNKKKYQVIIYLDGKKDPPVIQKAVQTKTKNGKELKNVTRFPNNFDMHLDKDYITDIDNYDCKYKWYYQRFDDDKDDNQDNDGWKQFDGTSSKQIEMVYNQEGFSIILNKGDFSTPSLKGLCTVKFNHHSIPSEPTLYKQCELKKDIETEIKFEEIESKDDDSNIATSNDDDEIMSMIMLTKHYMRPLSMKYWTQKRELSKNDPMRCIICYDEFDEENFLEHWVSRKIRKKHNEETEMVSSKQIAVQLCACAGEHFFHAECVAQYLAPKRKCPLCAVGYGVEMGNQPLGIMMVRMEKDVDCASKTNENKGKGTIKIIHKFKGGFQGPKHQNPGQRYSSRTEYIYLPRTVKGMEILGMIRIAWKRDLLYTVGRSVTRSLDNMIIWNGIHFKTSRYGGYENYGWPDPTYFDRVKDEFKQKGITTDDIEERYKPRKRK